ncbi:MAG: cell division protein FtsZ [Leptospira sp.]|nr:cell division protein FtsZ [Leptospira sp.]
MLYLEEEKTSPANIKVVGIGGGGMNAVTRMVNSQMKGVDFLVMNTDEQVLLKSPVEHKIQLGTKVTRGMGAGGDPDLGQKAAIEDKDRIVAALKGADMVFITAGMGGGTGTGAAPVIAAIAKEMKCLVVGVVTVPFSFEGKRRADLANQGIEELKANVDTLITIRNDSIFQVVDRNTPIDQAFRVIDDILLNGVRGISDIVNHPGIINVDFADVKTIMRDTGDAILGVGEGRGETRVVEAVEQAINNSLLEDSSIQGAKSLLINVTGGSDLTIHEWNEVSQIITSQADPDANIIIGLNEDKSLEDKIRVTVIATGFQKRVITKQVRENKAVGQNDQNFTSMDFGRKNEDQARQNRENSIAPDNGRNLRMGQRNLGNTRNSPNQAYNNFGEDYDIPAFLRRKAEG